MSGTKDKVDRGQQGQTKKGKDKTPTVEVEGNSSCSLEESAFSIDHILESVVSKLDHKTLLSCRLVSLRWAYFAAKELQKTVYIRLDSRECNESRYIRRLIDLLNKSTEFPSSTFTVFGEVGYQMNPMPLFKAHGLCIKRLKLIGSRVSLHDVKQFLLTQAPNIQQLILSMKDEGDYLGYKPPKGVKVKGSHVDGTLVSPQPTIPTLKVFKCEEHIPELFVQHLLKWSPNLIEVAFPSEYFHLLVKPVNRVHLLKKLKTNSYWVCKGLECLANHYEDLALKKIEFRHCSTTDDDVSRILKGSSATCQKLGLHYEFNFENLPQMPRMKHLSIHGSRKDSSPVDLFERWACLGDTFPNLRSLSITIYSKAEVYLKHSFFGRRVPAGIVSVKDVAFSPYIQRHVVLQNFQSMFPNATFRTLCPSELDKEDKFQLIGVMSSTYIEDSLHFNLNI